MEGLAENYMGTHDYRLAELIIHLFPTVCIILMVKIMQWFLNQKQSNSYFKTILGIGNCIIILIAILFIADYFIHFNSLISMWLQTSQAIFVGLQLLLVIISAIEKTIQKYNLAWAYLCAIVWLLVGLFEFIAVYLGVNDVEIIKNRHPNDLQIGLVIEAVVVFIAIIYRYNLYKKEKEKLLIELTGQQRNFIERIVAAEEEEHKRIATDLHDDVGATLSTLNLYASNITEKTLSQSAADKYYKQVSMLSNKAANDIRNIAHNLLPKDFTTAGLFMTLQKRIDELNALMNIRFILITEGEEKKLNEVFSVIVYRIINELLNNIIKHSLASAATVQLLIEEKNVQIMTEDDGIGFKSEQTDNGIGLKNITHRVEFLKGTILIDSNHNGTNTIINLPV